MSPRPAARAGTLAASLGLAVLAVSLAGCVTLFPKTKPAQLYRFGPEPAASAAPATSGARFAVLVSPIGFDRAAGADQLLTVTGDQVAYIKDARWAVAAPVMFETALHNAFDAANGPARLIGRGEISHADEVMKLDVRTFEARYDHGPAAAPTIVVQVRVALSRGRDASLVGDRLFEAAVPAADNRVSAIAEAFTQATDKVLGDIVPWVGASGAPIYEAPATPAPAAAAQP